MKLYKTNQLNILNKLTHELKIIHNYSTQHYKLTQKLTIIYNYSLLIHTLSHTYTIIHNHMHITFYKKNIIIMIKNRVFYNKLI